MLKVGIKETSETCPRLLGMSAADVWAGPRPPPHLALSPFCPLTLISIRVVCCGLFQTLYFLICTCLLTNCLKGVLRTSQLYTQNKPLFLPLAGLDLKVLLETCVVQGKHWEFWSKARLKSLCTLPSLSLPQLSPLYNGEESNIHLPYSWEGQRGQMEKCCGNQLL